MRRRVVRPEEAGIGAAAHRWAKDASDRSRSRVVSGGEQKLSGRLDADSGQGDEAGAARVTKSASAFLISC